MALEVFLGGTVGNNKWRDGFIDRLVAAGVPAECLFNPVVDDWNEAVQEAEERAKAEAMYLMFYIADPMQQNGPLISAYSLVEATMGLYDHLGTTVLVFDKNDLVGHTLKAINQCEKVLRRRFQTGYIFGSSEQAEEFFIDRLGNTTVA